MINNNEVANVKFDSEQSVQIETFRKKIASLETEASIHSRTISELRTENATLEKYKSYLEGQKSSLENEISGLQKKEEDLRSAITVSETSLQENTKKHQEMLVIQGSKQTELELRENELVKKESDNEIVRKNLELREDNIAQEEALLESKNKTLSEALKAIGN